MFERIQKWLALRSYRGELGFLLVDRYGRERCYTPPQVLATIKAHGLSQRRAAYACAMFCSKRGYEAFLAAGNSQGDAKFAKFEPATGAPIAGWSDFGVSAWPTHHSLAVELHHAHGSTHHSDFGSDSSGHASGHLGGHYDAGSHYGGDHYGGGGHGGGHYGGDSGGGGHGGGSDGGGGHGGG